MVLDRKPDNFFAETEQVAFCPPNIVPGIDFSNDPLLQGRLFSYLDTQLSRLGSPNFHQIPINAPKCPFANHAARRAHADAGSPRAASPTSRTRWRRRLGRARRRGRASARFAAIGDGREGPRPRRELRRPLQPGAAVLPQPDADRAGAHGLGAGVRAVEGRARAHPRGDGRPPAPHRRGPGPARRRRAWRWTRCPRRRRRPRPVRIWPPSPALQIIGKMKDTLEGRAGRHPVHRRLGRRDRRGAAQGRDRGRRDGEDRRAQGRRRDAADGKLLAADGQLAGTPSVLFDAVAIVLSDEGARALPTRARRSTSSRDAFGHLKAIAIDAGGQALLTAPASSRTPAWSLRTDARRSSPPPDAPVGPRAEGAHPGLSRARSLA